MAFFKRIWGWYAAWLNYWTGHLCARILELFFVDNKKGEFKKGGYFMWSAYQYFMENSSGWQDWGGGFGPWKPVTYSELLRRIADEETENDDRADL